MMYSLGINYLFNWWLWKLDKTNKINYDLSTEEFNL
jgi:hypothetical protein